MESRNIDIAASHSVRKVNWQGIDNETEWKYIGEGSSFEIDKAQEIINKHISGQTIYLVNGRHNSDAIAKGMAAIKVAHALKEQNILLCDSSFKEFIEFSYIGVLRYGTRSS